MNESAWKKCIHPYNYMSAVVKISFFHPKNVGFLNSKYGRVADTNQTIGCGLDPFHIVI